MILETGTVYPRFAVRFVTLRMILEKQELFTPNFSEVPYITDDHRETGTDKQFLLLYDHPSCKEPH
jgi:hypothetical protein